METTKPKEIVKEPETEEAVFEIGPRYFIKQTEENENGAS